MPFLGIHLFHKKNTESKVLNGSVCEIVYGQRVRGRKTEISSKYRWGYEHERETLLELEHQARTTMTSLHCGVYALWTGIGVY